MPIEFLKPNPRNPRRNFSDAELDELAASIKERGIIQPVVVRAVRGAKDTYEIIAGERRWRAAQRAGLHDVPIVVIEASDGEALELAIIENVQRTDLNALEEAGGYEALANEFDHSHDEIAKIVGKSRSHVTNTLRLLKLSEPIKAYVRAGKLSAGHARMLIGQPNADELAEDIVNRGPQRAPGRGDGAQERQGAGEGAQAEAARGQGCRHRRAGEAAVGRARPAGQRRPPRQVGRAAHPLPRSRPARRRIAEAGAGVKQQ